MDIEVGAAGGTKIIMEAEVVGTREADGPDGREVTTLYDVTAFRVERAQTKPVLTREQRRTHPVLGSAETAGVVTVTLFFEGAGEHTLTLDESTLKVRRFVFPVKIEYVSAPGVSVGWAMKPARRAR